MKGKAFIASYEVHAQADGEIVIVKLVKETEESNNGLVLGAARTAKKGFAGTFEVIVYDKVEQDRIKRLVGQEIEVDFKW